MNDPSWINHHSWLLSAGVTTNTICQYKSYQEIRLLIESSDANGCGQALEKFQNVFMGSNIIITTDIYTLPFWSLDFFFDFMQGIFHGQDTLTSEGFLQ